MPRFAANVSLLYADLPFAQRWEAAARDGFTGVECQFPYAVPAAELAARRADAGVEHVLLNAPPGDFEAGERGLACLPGREDDFRRGFERALAWARALHCPRVHAMAGVAPPGADPARLQATFEANLAWAAAQAAPEDVQVLVEPINPRDFPGYFLQRQDHAHATVARVGASNLRVQLDLYHCQVVEGDVTMHLRAALAGGGVGHLQVAGVPDRHEPDTGELRHEWLFAEIDRLSALHGWDGWVGAEYRPRRGATPGATTAGLGWFAPWRRGG